MLRRFALVVDAGACGGGADGAVEEPGGGPVRWGAGGAGGSVESDDGVEVDLAAFLVLGDLGVRERGVVPQRALGEAGGLGDLPAQVGGEACPQGRGVGVPQDRSGVVVVLGVERGAEERVVVGVLVAAVAAAGVGLVVDGAEAGGGEGGEDAWVGGDAGGDGLAAAEACGDELVGVVAVDGKLSPATVLRPDHGRRTGQGADPRVRRTGLTEGGGRPACGGEQCSRRSPLSADPHGPASAPPPRHPKGALPGRFASA